MQLHDDVFAAGRQITPERWEAVAKSLLAKMFSEFWYEEIIRPEVIGQEDESFLCRLGLGNDIEYRFKARKRMFDSWRVVPESITRHDSGQLSTRPDPVEFMLELQHELELDGSTTAHFVREITHTLIADAHLRAAGRPSADALCNMSYPEVEGWMEGHPWIVFNKGRMGFGYDDYLAYAPERRETGRLYWVAVRRARAQWRSVAGLDYDTLIRQELSERERERFAAVLEAEGLDAEDYLMLPVHPWQWSNVIVPSFAHDIASRDLVAVGWGDDLYRVQQSVRTFVNISSPARHHVKVPLSILNTLVYRGLPAERTLIAPKVTRLIQEIRDNDAFLRDECRLVLPGEVASINYDHSYYPRIENIPYQLLELVGCVWRENLERFLEPGEQAITLAALLYEDDTGRTLVETLVERSGMAPEQWLRQLLEMILWPLLHYLYQYGLVFSPHGQNAVLIHREGRPVRFAVKDYVDDVNFTDQPLREVRDLEPELRRVLRSEPPEGLCQFIQTGLFVCHFRYLSDLLERRCGLDERRFWGEVHDCVFRYQTRFQHLETRFQLFDLMQPTIVRLCLNRNRLLQNGYGDDTGRPHAAEYGRVRNPLYEVAVESV